MLHRSMQVFVSLGLLAFATLAPAAETPLAALPGDTALLVRFKTPQATIEKAVAFVEKADEGYGRQLRQLSTAAGILISNPAQTGVDREQDWWLAVFLESGRDPGVVFVIPAKDSAAMQDAIQGDYHFVDYEDWLIYTEDKSTAEHLRGHIDKGDGETIADVMDDGAKQLLDAGDLAAYLNVTQVKQVYRTEIDQLAEQIDSGLARISESAPPTQGVNFAAIMQSYAQLIGGALQGLEDTEGLAAALNVADEHVSADVRVKLTADSQTDQFLQAHPPAKMDRLGELPAGKHVYAGLHGYTDVMMKWGAKIALSAVELDDEAQKTIESAVKEYTDLDFGSMVFFVGLGDSKEGILSYGTVAEVKPSDKAREITRKLAPAYGSMQFPGLRQEIEYEADAETIDGLPIDHVRVKQEYDQAAGGPFNPQAIMTMIFGPDGMNSRMAYPKGLQVQTLGGGPELMEEVLASLADKSDAKSAADSPAFRDTREHLAEKANGIALIDLPSLAVQGLRLVINSGFFPLPLDEAQLDAIDAKESYVGFSLTTEPAAIKVKAYVPLAQVRGITQIVRQFQNMADQPPREL